MTFIGPNFQIVKSEELKIGMLRENKNNEIVGFEEIELLMGDTNKKLISIDESYRKELPLCKAGDNKHWVLGEDGKIKKQYLK